MAQVKVDGHSVDVVDEDCAQRPCFVLGFDKGAFTPGVGYTRYHDKPRPVCWTRHLNGCPTAGAHLICGDCRAQLALVMGDKDREKPYDLCPHCGSSDLYWLADVLPAPKPCCDNPDVLTIAQGGGRWRSKCRSCRTPLTGAALRRARGEEP